jgi:hypothetical protein
MVVYVILVALAAAAYANATAWLVPAATACLTIADWRPWQQGRQPRAAWSSSKATTYLVTGVVAHLALAAIAFGAGRSIRLLLG